MTLIAPYENNQIVPLRAQNDEYYIRLVEQAYKDGATIEYRPRVCGGMWHLATEPLWCWKYTEYRVRNYNETNSRSVRS